MSRYFLRLLCILIFKKKLGDIHSVFNNVGVDLCHAIDCMRANDAEMSHVDLLLTSLLNERHASHTVKITRVERRDPLRNRKENVRSKQSEMYMGSYFSSSEIYWKLSHAEQRRLFK